MPCDCGKRQSSVSELTYVVPVDASKLFSRVAPGRVNYSSLILRLQKHESAWTYFITSALFYLLSYQWPACIVAHKKRHVMSYRICNYCMVTGYWLMHSDCPFKGKPFTIVYLTAGKVGSIMLLHREENIFFILASGRSATKLRGNRESYGMRWEIKSSSLLLPVITQPRCFHSVIGT